jgi:serine/threonine-protein kinase HipA
VFLFGIELGTLTWVDDRKISYFFFSDEYFRQPYDLCPLTYPKDDPSTRLAIYGTELRDPDQFKKIYQGLPPFLADALPDKWGNAVFDEWFSSSGLPESAKTPITKLSFIGNRAMGALEFKPMFEKGFYEDKTIDLSELYKESLKIENKLNSRKVDAGTQLKVESIAALGTSPGGSRKKAIIAIAPDGSFHSGKTLSPPGWRNCIIKFNTPQYSLSEIEMAYYRLARDSGIEMMQSKLIPIENVQHFLTDRFDRQDGKKIMMQTLAAINPEARSYEDLFRTCRRLGANEREMELLFRQTAFNFLMNNTDDHIKNFSFLLGTDNRWHPSPAYDMTFIIAENGIEPERMHSMSLGGRFKGINENDLIKFAGDNGIKNPRGIIENIRKASMKFESYAKQYSMAPDIKELIAKTLEELGRPKSAVNIHHQDRSFLPSAEKIGKKGKKGKIGKMPGKKNRWERESEEFLDAQTTISKIWFDGDWIYGLGDDGKTYRQSLLWYNKLRKATGEQRARYEISIIGIHWHELDEDISFESFLYADAATGNH